MIQLWKMVYSDSRRKHSHRCRVCNKVLSSGEECFMSRIGNKTKAIHADCGSVRVGDGAIADHLELMGCQSLDVWDLKIGEAETIRRVREFILKNNLRDN